MADTPTWEQVKERMTAPVQFTAVDDMTEREKEEAAAHWQWGNDWDPSGMIALGLVEPETKSFWRSVGAKAVPDWLPD